MKTVTMRGKVIDMAALATKHAKTRAVGNVPVNARGDLIDARGNVVKPVEALRAEYHARNPRAVKQGGLRNISDEVLAHALTPSEAVQQMKAAKDEAKGAKDAAPAEKPEHRRPPRKLTDD